MISDHLRDRSRAAPVRSLVRLDGFAMLALSLVVAAVSGGLTIAAACVHAFAVARRTLPSAAGNAVLVLGMRSRRGVPERAYRARLDRALALSRSNPAARIIVLGGPTTEGQPSEAEIGRRYLIANGFPAARISIEDRSRHTLENLQEYRAAFPHPSAELPLLLVTSRFHLARAALLARGLGIEHVPCAAEERPCWTVRDMLLLAREAFFIHWYVVGRTYARLSGNRRMAARIT
ncbi:MAG TPA: YdcF family protein [Stellaceae bacterium]|jgi:uncharacterized SAM-binding protein YcdF (DUF218 family)